MNDIRNRINHLKDLSTVEKINRILVQEYVAQKSKTKSPRHKPSMLGSKCLRKIYYSYFHVAEDSPPDSRALRIFNTGDAIETMVSQWLQKVGEHIPYIQREQDFKDQFPVNSPRWRIPYGFLDGVGFHNGKLFIYEIKSCNTNKFTKLSEPMPDHLQQVAIYIQCFNDLTSQGAFSHIPELAQKSKAEGVKFIYVNKNTSEIKEFTISYETLVPVIKKLDEKILSLNAQYIDQKVLPPKTSESCIFCPYQKKCRLDWNDVEE